MLDIRRSALFLAVGTLALVAGCVTPLMMSSSTTPMAGRGYQEIGPTEAESCIESILGIPITFDASLHTTLAMARGRVQADALIEVTVDQYNLMTGFYNKVCTRVHAIGVRFTVEKAPLSQPAAVAPPEPPPLEAPPVVEEEPAKKEKKKLTKAEIRRQKAEEKRRAREEARREAAEEQKRKAEEAKRKAEEEKKTALLRKQAEEEARPVPAEYNIFCRYKPGQKILVETKSEKIEAEFVRCIYRGVQVKRPGKDPEVIPFDKVWAIRMLAPEPAGP